MDDVYSITNEGLLSFVKNTIAKYCPYASNRLYMLDSFDNLEMDILIDFIDDNTIIKFLLGTKEIKKNVLESIKINSYIDFNEIKNIIDYILKDHENIKYVDFDNYDKAEFCFDIKWDENKLNGLACNDINVKIDFHNNTTLSHKYMFYLLKAYSNNLENVPSFIKLKNEYFDNIKEQYIGDLKHRELKEIINQLTADELRELLKKIDNNVIYDDSDMVKKKLKKSRY